MEWDGLQNGHLLGPEWSSQWAFRICKTFRVCHSDGTSYKFITVMLTLIQQIKSVSLFQRIMLTHHLMKFIKTVYERYFCLTENTWHVHYKNQLMLLREIIWVYSENHIKQSNRVWKDSVSFFDRTTSGVHGVHLNWEQGLCFTASSRYSCHCAFKG
jgi:hypothetical protein